MAIVNIVRQLEDGDLSAQLELPYPASEPIGALAARVNSLLKALSARRQETITYQRELEAQIATIEQQQQAIAELSTPIIEVWRGVLCVPIVGVFDSRRAADLTSTLLNAVADKKAPYVIVDITGIDAMDTRATDHFLRMARAVRLLGASCVISGVSPSVAQTITHMGVQLEGLRSYRTLGTALAAYVRAQRAPRARAGRAAQSRVAQAAGPTGRSAP